MKNILIVLLAAVLCFPLGIVTAAEETAAEPLKEITPTMVPDDDSGRRLSRILSNRKPVNDPADEAEKQAEALKSLGLFQGVSDTDFDLDRAPTRVEAVVMLLRLLGSEEEALSGSYSHPFVDVPEWADAYIGYAYQEGIANGISSTEFGMGDASAAMYLTYVLRALGYSDADGDFAWDDPFALAEDVKILDDSISRDDFLRADVVRVSYKALSAKLKDSESTLAEMLMRAGVFTPEELLAVGIDSKSDGSPIVYILPVEPKPGEATK